MYHIIANTYVGVALYNLTAVLASEVDEIQKYSDKEGRRPKINKLGGGEWDKTRKRVKGHVAEVAKELVTLYAKRRDGKGHVYPADTVWQKEFQIRSRFYL